MLDRDHNDIVFRCDGPGCHAALEAGTSNFEAARNVLRRNRWQPKKNAREEWEHLCPDCQAQEQEERLV